AHRSEKKPEVGQIDGHRRVVRAEYNVVHLERLTEELFGFDIMALIKKIYSEVVERGGHLDVRLLVYFASNRESIAIHRLRFRICSSAVQDDTEHVERRRQKRIMGRQLPPPDLQGFPHVHFGAVVNAGIA